MKANGHFFSKDEIKNISQEFTNSLFQAIALHHPVKLVTPSEMIKLEDGKGYTLKSGAVFFESKIESKEALPRFNTLPVVRALIMIVCAEFLTAINTTWERGYNDSTMYLLDNFSVQLMAVQGETEEDQKLKVQIYACIAGDLASGEKDNPEKTQEILSMVQQPKDQAIGGSPTGMAEAVSVPEVPETM